MIGDFTILDQSSSNGGRGSRSYNTASGANAINPGEPVVRGVTGSYVTRMYGSGTTGSIAPVVATDYVVGIAQTTSTQTATIAGSVEVLPVNSGTTWLVSPTTAASWDTQAEYDALVGKRVLIDFASSTYTLAATDGTSNGLVVMPLDVLKYPGKVAVAFRSGLSDVN